MPKLGMQPIRRRQLIDATIASIHEDGFANTTISGISRRAGLSSGIVAHYFDDKAGLLEATMRKLAEDLRRQLVEVRRFPSADARVADTHLAQGAELMELNLSSLPELRLAIIDDLDASITPDLVGHLKGLYPACVFSVEVDAP